MMVLHCFRFSEAESEPPLETWEFLEEKEEGKPHTFQMGGAKLRNTQRIQISVETNAGAEVTKLKQLELYGQPVDDGKKHWSVTNPQLKYGND